MDELIEGYLFGVGLMLSGVTLFLLGALAVYALYRWAQGPRG